MSSERSGFQLLHTIFMGTFSTFQLHFMTVLNSVVRIQWVSWEHVTFGHLLRICPPNNYVFESERFSLTIMFPTFEFSPFSLIIMSPMLGGMFQD